MDQSEARAVTEWLKPATVKQLQCFLGFANLYRQFIWGFNSIPAPFTSLLKNKAKCL